MYVYIHIYVCTYIYIYIYVCNGIVVTPIMQQVSMMLFILNLVLLRYYYYHYHYYCALDASSKHGHSLGAEPGALLRLRAGLGECNIIL